MCNPWKVIFTLVPLALLILLAPLSPMLLIKVFGGPPFIYPKKCDCQKIHVKFIILEYEMNFIKMMKNMAFKKIKSKFHILIKFQCILFLHSSFDGDLKFFIFWHWHTFWVHIFHLICMTKRVSSFQKSIRSSLFS